MRTKVGIAVFAVLTLGLGQGVLAQADPVAENTGAPAAEAQVAPASELAAPIEAAPPASPDAAPADAQPAAAEAPAGLDPAEAGEGPAAEAPADGETPPAKGAPPAGDAHQAGDPAPAERAPAASAEAPAEGVAEVDMVAQLAAAPVDPSACEIHVWTQPQITALTTGWLVGFGVVGAVADSAGHTNINEANQADLTRLLTQNAQLAAIAKIDFKGVLGDKPYRLIPETSQLDLGRLDDDKERKTPSTHACYYEFVPKVVFYQKAAMYGRRLISTFVLREFGASEKMTRYYKGTDAVGLEMFPVEKIDDLPAATKEVLDAYAFAANKVIQKRRKK